MGNTFSGTTINNTSVAASCLEALKMHLVPLKMFSLSVGSEPTHRGAVEVVPLVSVATAATNATDYESGDSTVTGYPVTISENISSQCHLTAVEMSKQSTDLFQKKMLECTYAVAKKAITEVLELVVAGSFSPETIVASSALDADKLLDLKSYCIGTLKMNPSEALNMLIDTDYYYNLAKDPAIKDRSASGLDSGLTGEVARFAGVNVFETALLKALTVYGSTEYLKGFICQPRCMAVTIRPPAVLNESAYDSIENVTDPDSGLTLQVRQWTAPKSNTLWGAVEVLWGAAAVDGGAMYRVVSQ